MTHNHCIKNSKISQLITPYEYNDIAQALVEEFKFHFNTEFAKIITNYICKNNSFSTIFDKTSVIFVPVPLHIKREKWRGFNQATILAENLKTHLSFANSNEPDNFFAEDNINNIEVKSLLIRKKDTSQQAKLDRDKRIENVKNAFSLNIDMVNKISKSNRLILIDDVTTTTSTLQECAKILWNAGFKDIRAIVFARGK